MCNNAIISLSDWFTNMPPGMITFFVGLLGMIVGSFLTSWLAARRDAADKKYKFIEKQLNEFYSPMLGLRKEIQVHSELREELQDAASYVWSHVSRNLPPGQSSDDAYKPYHALIEYDNTKLSEHLIPAYNRMLDLFREKLWLVDEETLKFYPHFVLFVEIWNRYTAKSIPGDVIKQIGHEEEDLNLFYEHLDLHCKKLRSFIKMDEK